MPLDNLPSLQGRFGVDEAMLIVGEAFEAMEPDGALCEQWEEFHGVATRWAFREEQVPAAGLMNLRVSLEKICGDGQTGELLVAGAKLGLATVLLAATNIWHIVIPDRDEMHDYLGPICRKGGLLLHQARVSEPYDPTVRLDYDITDTLHERAGEAEADMHREWLGDLLGRAVRPEPNGG